MSNEQTKTLPRHINWWRIFRRILLTLITAMIIGWATHHVLTALNRGGGPAGFGRGMLQGALMPGALPNLLLGKDTVIYSENNAGISYKLGYTAGVNACGALFFGYFFWRLNRWRKKFQNLRKD